MYLVFLRRSPSTGPSGRFLEKGVRRGRAADWCATSLSKAEQVIITEAAHPGHQLDSSIEHSLYSCIWCRCPADLGGLPRNYCNYMLFMFIVIQCYIMCYTYRNLFGGWHAICWTNKEGPKVCQSILPAVSCCFTWRSSGVFKHPKTYWVVG